MMKKIAAGVLLLAGIGLFAQATVAAAERGVELGGPALAPLIVTGLWVAVSAAYAVQAFKAGEGEQAKAGEGEQAKAGEGEKLQANWRTPLLLLGVLVAYAVVLKYTVVGYVLATAAFFFGAARLLQGDRDSMVRDASVAIGLSLAIYLVFTRLLSIALPSGVLPL
jgi:putative tricarboxylic transport membrane protein